MEMFRICWASILSKKKEYTFIKQIEKYIYITKKCEYKIIF